MADVKIESESSDSQPLVDTNQPAPPQPPQPQPPVEEEENQPKASVTPTPPPPPPQYMAMRYPPAVVLPHHMMYAPPPPPPPYSPYHQYPNQHHPHLSRGGNNNKHQNASNGENKTIWVGDLHHWMDEPYLNSSFGSAGEIVSVKVIRNKHNGYSEGYGFVEFESHDVADKVLQKFNGATMPTTEQPFRLNWASFSTGEKRLENNGPDLSIFVGDLAPDVSDTLLHETFSEKYPSVKAAKVVFDATTRRSKGYGFVRFGDDNERNKAMTEMNGVKCSSRAMRIGPATPRKTTGYQQQGGYMPNGAMARPEGETLNTTIFVGGLDSSVTDEDLRQPFSDYGEIVSVKIPVGKGCGFVQFVNRPNAEEALEKLNGTVIGKQTVRLSWGHSPANKQPRDKYGNQWVVPYYGGQYFNGYGYMAPQPHDPRMYPAAPYGGYPMYGGHQQQVS
ncbi:PREDICTED: polyadenylate-binding protein RBP47C-like [Camelina sativa]|uniref:Polyadenylate-binding protein RBP47C-like n=1 Tax=Camelina sativa TaxID=90675 RepID=A0ABM0VV62_CAMSA|nr:PREDICTED: polyadenylate-binding protein RBP47C-like [Camelina sativa]